MTFKNVSKYLGFTGSNHLWVIENYAALYYVGANIMYPLSFDVMAHI